MKKDSHNRSSPLLSFNERLRPELIVQSVAGSSTFYGAGGSLTLAPVVFARSVRTIMREQGTSSCTYMSVICDKISSPIYHFVMLKFKLHFFKNGAHSAEKSAGEIVPLLSALETLIRHS